MECSVIVLMACAIVFVPVVLTPCARDWARRGLDVEIGEGNLAV